MIDPNKTNILNEVVEVNDIPYQLDVKEATDVEISIKADGKVLWVNVDGICALRVSRIDRLKIEDARPDSNEIMGGLRDVQHTD